MRVTGVRIALLGTLLVAPAGAVELETEEQKTLYAIGLAISQSLAAYNLSESELGLVQAGLADGALGRDAKVDVKDYRDDIQKLGRERAKVAADKERAASAAFLEKMAKEKGAQTSESGLVYIVETEGTGAQPKATDTVKVHYHGTLRDGTVFDSSVERGQPATFPFNRVIKCWTEGVQKMKTGGKSTLICPSEIAYGDRGSPPKIPGGATLVFEVELLSVEEAKKPAAGHP